MSLTKEQVIARYVVDISYHAATAGFLRKCVVNTKLSVQSAVVLLFTDGVSMVWRNEKVRSYLIRQFTRIGSYPQRDMTGPHLVLIKNAQKGADCWYIGRRLAKLIFGSKVTHIVQVWAYSRNSQAMEICNPIFRSGLKDQSFKTE